MSSNDDSPTLGDVFEAAFRKTLAGLRTWLPGEIRAYDPGPPARATVQVMIPDGWFSEQGERQTSTLKPMTDVPVAQCGSGSTRVKFPIRVGDPCLVLFSSSCLTAYKASGRLLDPKDDRHHHEADAFVIPMPRVVGDVESEAMIEFTEDGQILAGGSQALATKADVTALANFVQGLFVGGSGSTAIPPGTVPQPTGTTVLKGG